MHAQGDPETMQLSPTLCRCAHSTSSTRWRRGHRTPCVAAGIAARRGSLVDPGIGFGKTLPPQLSTSFSRVHLFHGLGVAVLMGLSRKGFVGALTGEKIAGETRVNGFVGGAVWSALQRGAHPAGA